MLPLNLPSNQQLSIYILRGSTKHNLFSVIPLIFFLDKVFFCVTDFVVIFSVCPRSPGAQETSEFSQMLCMQENMCTVVQTVQTETWYDFLLSSSNIRRMKLPKCPVFAIPLGKKGFCFLKLLWSICLIIAQSHGFFIQCCFSKTGIQKRIYWQ